ncbi:MAG: hypothetical protein CVU38_18585 [Chloroflexi bacterium HGW-Chloroflexi-1]|nr:MAG: hypothetical protein CVU38_18585 [Chloroflexi bacterium HGW-Chloroflexi-1]
MAGPHAKTRPGNSGVHARLRLRDLGRRGRVGPAGRGDAPGRVRPLDRPLSPGLPPGPRAAGGDRPGAGRRRDIRAGPGRRDGANATTRRPWRERWPGCGR